MESLQPRRSALYVPANKPRAVDKARQLPVDAIILDLEDAVAPEAKPAAREAAVAALAAGGFGKRELVVRVNGLDTPWGKQDLVALAGARPHAVLLPKADSASEIEAACAALPGCPLWIMAETPRGVLDLDRLLGLHPDIRVVVMGLADLAKATRVPAAEDRSGLLGARSSCVLAARAHGRDILDGVHTQLRDPDGFLEACRDGRRLGFDGKTLIHPEQIVTANDVFGVSETEASQAQAVVDAWNRAQREGSAGVITVDGRLVERLHVEQAERLLALRAETQIN